MKKFINRYIELEKLNKVHPGLIVLFGRRRVGKTTLVEKWAGTLNFHYTQAIEGSTALQLEQIRMDLAALLPEGLVPRSWSELFAILKTIKEECVVVIDEFPYLVRTNPELPSILQKWVDHDRPENLTLVILGSSQSMMHGLFLDASAPLYERAEVILKVEPMAYRNFCEALQIDPLSESSFLKYSLIGGVPRYWRFAEGIEDPLVLAQQLYFEKGSRLEDEPDRLLKDEDIGGQQAKAIFESIGRGATKPSEIAMRMEIHQTALSKPLQILLNTSLICRTIPFGDSPRNSKKTIYRICDYALRFWYQVYSPHRSRWHLYSKAEKMKLVREHASKVLEDEIRGLYPDAAPYWEGQLVEFDLVRFEPKDLNRVIVTEIKFKDITDRECQRLTESLEQKFQSCKLAQKYGLSRVEVLDWTDALKLLAKSDLELVKTP